MSVHTGSGIPAGAEGVEHLRRTLAELVDPVELHAFCVERIHIDVGLGLDLEMSRYMMGRCRELVEQGVPCRKPDAEVFAAVALLGSTWPAELEAETAELMRLYIRRGYFRLNDHVDAFGAGSYSTRFAPGITALERAIREGHACAAGVLIEEGESADCQPYAEPGKEGLYPDMYTLAQWWSPGTSLEPAMRAAAMRRTMSQALADAGTEPRRRLAPSPRRAAV